MFEEFVHNGTEVSTTLDEIMTLFEATEESDGEKILSIYGERVYEECFFQELGEYLKVEKKKKTDILGNELPESSEEGEEKVMCIIEDYELIAAAFWSQYGVKDIKGMQFKTFRALLSGLEEGTVFRQVVKIRSMDIPSGKGTHKEAAEVRRAKESVKLRGGKKWTGL